MARQPPAQLDLFGGAAGPAVPFEKVWTPEIESLAARLPQRVRLGTSSWTFSGWEGICYPTRTTEAQLQREGLSIYSKYPLFRTVGIDRTYYKPMTRGELEDYAEQLPSGFRCVEKVWDRLMMPVFPSLPRYGIHAGQRNPSFLDAALFHDMVHAPHVGVFDDHLAAYVLEFPPIPPVNRPRPEVFARRLARFLDEAPYGPRYAVEVRNREFLCEEYFQVLRERNVSHVYNYWSWMPTIGEQLDLTDPPGSMIVARLMIRPGTEYEERKAEFAPFNRLQDVDPEMRADVVRLALLALERGWDIYVIANNKAEGCSPLTVVDLAKLIADATNP